MSKARPPTANRGPIPYDNTVSAATFDPPIGWIHVASIGAGGLVVKDEAGTTRTYTSAHLYTGLTIYGPFSEITSSTCTALLAGDGPAPRALPTSTVLGSTAAGQGADTIGYPDASSKTSETTVGGAVDELYVNATTAQATIPIDLSGAILAAGTPMAAWADNASSNPGITLANSKAVGLRWNNNASQTAVWLHAPMPQDLDDTADLVLHALVSKTGATVGDATTLTVTGFFQTVGALHDADSDVGGTSSAVVGDATAKTVSEVTLTIDAADVPASPSSLSLSVKPSDSTLGTDDFIVHAIWIEYTRKLLAS